MIGESLGKPTLDLYRQQAVTRRNDIGHMGAAIDGSQMAAAMAGVHQCVQKIVAFCVAVSGLIAVVIVGIMRISRPNADVVQIAHRHEDRIHQRGQHQQRHGGVAKQMTQRMDEMTRHGRRC